MLRKKVALPSIEFPCLNCDNSISLTSYVKLFCSEACGDEARLVRYVRRCRRDGRINQPDVKEAIEIKFAHALSGGYKAKERKLHPFKRAAIFERDKGLCQKCGQPGTEIDHMNGSSNEIEDLQLLCDTCHNEKTKSKFTLLTPAYENYEEIEAKRISICLRIDAVTPQRDCDDDENWFNRYSQFMLERQNAIREARQSISDEPSEEETEVPKEKITKELNELGELYKQSDALKAEKQSRVDQILAMEIDEMIPPEIRAKMEEMREQIKVQLAEVDAEFAAKAESLEDDIVALETKIKKHVTQYGSTVGSFYVQAVWNKGRVTWDTESIEEYAELNPQILMFRRVSEPSVSIRRIK